VYFPSLFSIWTNKAVPIHSFILRVRTKKRGPENDGKHEGKSWNKVEHGSTKRGRAVLYTSIL
jgi:hypothetical protein